MAPGADLRVGRYLPTQIIDYDTAPREFEGKSRRRFHVKRGRSIVGVVTQTMNDSNATRDTPIESKPDVVHTLHLKHKVVYSFRKRQCRDGRGVMTAGRGMEEGHFDVHTRSAEILLPYVVGDPQSEHVAVKRDAFIIVSRDLKKMTNP